MKILLISDYATPSGGTELLMLGLREGLRRRGHDARFFASDASTSAALPNADYLCRGALSPLQSLLQVMNPWAVKRLRTILRAFQPDVIHVALFLTQLSPLILPLLRATPSLYHAMWYRAVCPIGTKMLPDGTTCQQPAGVVCYQAGCVPLRHWGPRMLQLRLWRRWRHVFRLVVAPSVTVQHALLAEGIGPVEVIENGVPERPMHPPLTAPPTVVFAGRLVREKGVHVLLHAFAAVVARIPDARLLIAGDGPERETLNALVRRLGVEQCVSMLGHVSLTELEGQCAAAWVHVVPSLWAEPFGNVAIEAMMRGTAVVASRAGGLAEIVEDGITGRLVPAGEVPVLAEVLTQLLSTREAVERLGARGRAVALARFGEARYVERVLGVYERLVEKKSPRMG
jgi:glycosyltransferase involved in cell wall biosynthesis